MSQYLQDLFESTKGNTDYKALKRAFIQERNCPELQLFETLAVSSIIDEIAKKQDLIDSSKDTIVSHLYNLEIDRLKFLLSGYLRTRLHKV